MGQISIGISIEFYDDAIVSSSTDILIALALVAFEWVHSSDY